MKTESRAAAYDAGLRVEAYRFTGIVQRFPSHFHNCYVIGYVESGERRLSCCGRSYDIGKENLLLFHPGDPHACEHTGGAFGYRSLHICPETMLDFAEEATGRRELPGFSRNVTDGGPAARFLCSLHKMLMRGADGLGREESLLLLLSALLRQYGQPRSLPACREEVERVCQWMERHYAEQLTLDQLCRCAGLGKSTLLRAFAKARGTTPYRYLENIRVNEAKRLLEEGVPPLDAAMRTGFSDQSHFTNCFRSLIGLPPGAYRRQVQRL